jgi:hypothetical protein
MVTSTWKFAKECMDSFKPVSLPTPQETPRPSRLLQAVPSSRPLATQIPAHLVTLPSMSSVSNILVTTISPTEGNIQDCRGLHRRPLLLVCVKPMLNKQVIRHRECAWLGCNTSPNARVGYQANLSCGSLMWRAALTGSLWIGWR